MRINDVSQITGLSKKAIRLYESKGLLTVQRISNGYRDYTEADIELLKKIKLFRLAGVSVSDIKLLNDNVISIEELLEKRKCEIEKEGGKYSEQYSFCDEIMSRFRKGGLDCKYELEENEEIIDEKHGALAVAIDIGTTTISAAVFDLTYKNQVEAYCIPNHFKLSGKEPFFDEQDADAISKKASELLNHIINRYSGITSIGITGQMHGIVYIDVNGKAVSPLITWQDKRADQIFSGNETYCDRIKRLTGEKISTGFGFATHYYNIICGLVPKTAVSFCSIMDYLVMRLTEKKSPLVHSSVAASFGMFDICKYRFMTEKLAYLKIYEEFLPEVTKDNATCGVYRGIPVSVAIGDNQASFLGSVKTPADSILINIGTGSQISMMSDYCTVGKTVELRPFIGSKYLICGSALCGGSAYAMLERFFREYSVSAGGRDTPQYETMNLLASAAYESAHAPLNVDTAFGGTRADPARRGAIYGIDEKNFTPANLTLGVLHGIVRELYDFFVDADIEGKSKIVASGGAVQKNKTMQRIISDIFEMPVSLSANREEASVGAALFSALAVGFVKNIEELSEYINYKPEDLT